jgi:hypothetical protein
MPHIIEPAPSQYVQKPPEEQRPTETDEEPPINDASPEIRVPQTPDPAPALFRLETE